MEFIGREREMGKMLGRKIFLAPTGGRTYPSCSLTGLNGIGKTALIDELARRLQEKKDRGEEGFQNVFYVYMTVTGMSEDDRSITYYWYFWKKFFETLSRDEDFTGCLEKCREKGAYGRVRKSLDYFAGENCIFDDAHASGYLDFFFDDLARLGIRLIVAIDEFDKTRTILQERGENGRLYNALFSFSSVKVPTKNISSFILISRRSTSTIAFDMKGGSNFPDAFPQVALRGFTDPEMDEYFSLYDGEEVLELNEEEKKKIRYFCGRHPGMLSALYDRLEEEESVSESKFDELLEEVINNPYDQMDGLLKTEYADVNKRENFLNKYIQLFIGPCTDSRDILNDAKSDMNKYGFITKISEDDGYSSIMLQFDPEWEMDYEPISPYYIHHIREKVMPEDRKYLDDLLENVELTVREVIKQCLKDQYGNEWSDHVDDNIPMDYNSGTKKKDSYYVHLKDFATRNHAGERGIEYSKLDVLAFFEYYSFFIRRNWNLYRNFFPDYADKQALGTDFSTLTDLRNPFAHHTARIFTREEVEKGQELCRKLLKGMEDALKARG